MAAPKHNRFAIGNNGGRPMYYETPEEMYPKIMEYFEWVENENNGKATLTGLVLYLGFDSRKSLFDYEEKKEFSSLIKRARAAVENYYEEKLTSMTFGGAIFALKNMGWVDKVEQDVKQTITNVQANFGNTLPTP